MRQSCDCANNGDKENAGCLKIRQADFFKTGVFCQPLASERVQICFLRRNNAPHASAAPTNIRVPGSGTDWDPLALTSSKFTPKKPTPSAGDMLKVNVSWLPVPDAFGDPLAWYSEKPFAPPTASNEKPLVLFKITLKSASTAVPSRRSQNSRVDDAGASNVCVSEAKPTKGHLKAAELLPPCASSAAVETLTLQKPPLATVHKSKGGGVSNPPFCTSACAKGASNAIAIPEIAAINDFETVFTIAPIVRYNP